MKIIKCLVENIEEELNDAEKYAKMALEYKVDYPELIETFLTLSKQEVNHATMLHNHAERIIKDYRSEYGDAPAPMQAVYDWEHGKMIDAMAKVRVLHELAAGK